MLYVEGLIAMKTVQTLLHGEISKHPNILHDLSPTDSLAQESTVSQPNDFCF
jgi:hypothetical protein